MERGIKERPGTGTGISSSSGFGGSGEILGSAPTPISSTQMRPESSTSAATSKSMSVFLWKSGEMAADLDDEEDYRNLTIRPAIGIIFLAFVFILIAFTTPSWLETDGDLPKPNKFVKIGKPFLRILKK